VVGLQKRVAGVVNGGGTKKEGLGDGAGRLLSSSARLIAKGEPRSKLINSRGKKNVREKEREELEKKWHAGGRKSTGGSGTVKKGGGNWKSKRQTMKV